MGSASVVFIGNTVARGLGFLFPLALARVIDRDGFAIVYFLIGTGFFVGELAMAGYPTAMTRFVSADPSRRSAWVGSAIAGGMPLLAMAVAAGAVLAALAGAPILFMVVVVVGLTIDAYYFALLRGLGWFGTLMLYRIAANAGQLVVLLAAAWMGLASAGLAVGAYSLLYLAPIVFIEWRRSPIRSALSGRPRVSVAHLRTLTAFSIPALASGIAFAAIQGLDLYFVRLNAAGQLADYSAARSLAMPMQLLPFAVTVILLPRVAAASRRDSIQMLKGAFGATLAALILLGLAYLLMAGLLIDLFFPSSYRGAAGLLVLLAPASGVVGLYSVLSQWWMGTGRPSIPAACLMLGAAVALLAQVVLTPRLGAPGAAAAMTCGAAFAVALLGAVTVVDVRKALPGRLRRAG